MLYSCLFVDADGHVTTPAEYIDAPSNEDATLRALEMLSARRHHAGIELFVCGTTRRIYAASRKQEA